ncbi:hypothetical protein QF023_001273 [Chryseobacterium sp. SLBN-27]|uniref:COG1470 family protein n=1 Tax=Chryseobacterium sp. SLBN-27 TaxID=3042287 RepID=UPI002862D18B|nr:hypothetical protein [Chryseobacterium sp. SLBN-27]MDR6157757.1 hypothetical protein [Chryseobacterium sp. SLBN-27]
MFLNHFRRIFFLFLISFIPSLVSAQNSSGITMEIRDDSNMGKDRIISTIAEIKNNSQNHFKGKLSIVVPKGFRNISGNTSEIEVPAGGHLYLPIKILVSSNAGFGDSKIDFTLTDIQNTIIIEKTINHTIAENNSMAISTDTPIIYMSNVNDSIEVRARVSNLGNKKQDVTIVFKIPEADQGSFFVEKKGSISVQKDSVFVYRFRPSNNLANTPQFSVNIVGFREPDKEIFGNSTVSIQNNASSQRYQSLDNNNLGYTKNSITASLRYLGRETYLYQLIGSGGFNLPSGYVFIRGNIYKTNGPEDPVVNNTFITYKREKSEFTVGNISKIIELSLYGRGAEYAFTSSNKDKRLEFGFVDQSFSLIDRTSFLKLGYGFYVRGTLGASNASRNISAAYVFKSDPYEKVKHNLLGTDFQYAFNKDWKISGKLFSGMSIYESINTTKPSGALETQYSGIINKINLSGNYSLSSNYYPGNQRGIFQIQQNISSSIFKDNSIYANVMVSNFSPRFYFFDNNLETNSSRLEAGFNFPKRKNFGLGISLQYQNENSNTYNTFFGLTENRDLKQMTAKRLIERVSWSSTNRKHSSILGIETGLVNYPDSDSQEYQMKFTGNYAYKWLNFQFIYQYGSYYLSEFAFSKLLGINSTYEKTSASAFITNTMLKGKLSINSGLSYTEDTLYGKSPSGFVNVKFTKENYGFYLNSSWFNYSLNNFNNNLFTVEAGVTINLRSNYLDPGKKSSIKAFVYYDRNSNNVYDDGDEKATGYIIMINNISFKTDEDGNIEYRAIPYNKYTLRQVIQQGWYYDETEFDVTSHNHSLEIPLHQNGTVHGKVTYEYDTKTALEFDPKSAGIAFDIYKDEKIIRHIISDDNGEIISFIESGNYKIKLNENSLPSNTYCENTLQEFKVETGKISELSPFIIKVKEKKIRVKKFDSK